MRCSLTPFGIKAAVFGAVIALIFFATPYTSLFFLLVAFLSVLGLLGMVWGATNLRRIRVTIDPLPMAQAGEQRTIVAHATTTRGTCLGIGIQLELDGGERVDAACVPWVHGLGTVEASLPAMPRGMRQVQAVIVWSEQPLGFLRWQRRFQLARHLDLVTHPRRAATTPRAHMSPSPAADAGTLHVAANHGVVSSVRPWREGDDLRSVDWKASARRNDWVVREFEAEASDGVELVLDRRCEPGALETMLEQAAALVADRPRDQFIRIVSQDHDCSYGTEGKPFESALQWLAGADRLGHDAPAPPAAGPAALHLPLPEARR